MNVTEQQIRENYLAVLERIRLAAIKVGRNPKEIQLVVVSKSQPVEVLLAAYQAGIRIFGENYPQETEEKIKLLTQLEGIQWHMIGHLQSRKAPIIAKYFSKMHSVDSLYITEKIEKELTKTGRMLSVLLELNLASEQTKSGWEVKEEADLEELAKQIKVITSFPHIKLDGLMTMPPLFAEVEKVRPYFRKLGEIQRQLQEMLHGLQLRELSMGTSADYEIAVQEGATLVRIGQAILGARIMKG